MKADPRFMAMHSDFWANVRTIGEKQQFVNPRSKKKNRPRTIRVHTLADMQTAMTKSGLGSDHLIDPTTGQPTSLATQLQEYFQYRRDVLVNHVEPNLMCALCAKRAYEELKSQVGSTKSAPMNKQAEEKKQPAYFTGIVNMIVEAEVGLRPCNYNPGGLTTFTTAGAPLKTLSRRHDGGFPSVNDPISVWEVKEYYYTTTFGSKIPDGVYITQLDGMEIEEARKVGVDAQLVLMVDGYPTWWGMGIPYLCRLIDLLHMGYVDEILFGSEVLARLPDVVKTWVAAYDTKVPVSSPPASAAVTIQSWGDRIGCRHGNPARFVSCQPGGIDRPDRLAARADHRSGPGDRPLTGRGGHAAGSTGRGPGTGRGAAGRPGPA